MLRTEIKRLKGFLNNNKRKIKRICWGLTGALIILSLALNNPLIGLVPVVSLYLLGAIPGIMHR